MRVLCLFTLFMAFESQAQMCPCEFGQSGKTRRHELGVSVLSSIGEPGYYRVHEKAIIPNLFSGLNYKYHLDKFSWRAQAAYKFYQVNDSLRLPPLISPERTQGEASFIEFRAGIEKSITQGKWRFYAGADFVYGVGHASGTQQRYKDWNTSYKANLSYLGLSVLPGLNYRPWEKISFNLEPCFNITSNRQTANTGNDTYFRTYLLLNTLSINYHF